MRPSASLDAKRRRVRLDDRPSGAKRHGASERSRGSRRDDGRIALRIDIGVTGHLDLADPGVLGAQVRARLGELRAAFPCTEATRVQFGVLSSLAEGADRLVVAEAFATLGSAELRLHAVLPMSVDSYKEDFSSDESRSAFDELLRAAALTTELPVVEDRDESYARAGHYVVDNCDVLVALWDGRRAGGRGGTQTIVEYAQRQCVPVLVVPATRSSAPGLAPVATAAARRGALARESTLEAYMRVEEFNRQSKGEHELACALEKAGRELCEATGDAKIRAQTASVGAWALPRFVRADALAKHYQRRYYRLASALYLLAALAVASVAAQSQAGWSSKLALIEVACMLAVLAIYTVARRMGLRDRWFGYRSLAEALRSALFIALTNVDADDAGPSREDAAALHEHWFQRVFSAAWEARPAHAPDGLDPGLLRSFVIEAWLVPQIRYHEDTANRLRRKRVLLTRGTIALFVVTIVAGLLHAFELLPGAFWPSLLLFLALALPGFGAALSSARDLHQYRIHEHRCQRTARRLKRLRDQADVEDRPSSVQRLAMQIHAAIEVESADWSGVVEFQDLEMVV